MKKFDDFTVITVSIGYNRFLAEWTEFVHKLNTTPREVIIGIDQIDIELKHFIEKKLPNVKWIYLRKNKSRHYSSYYNLLINEVKTNWVCKIDVDDVIFPNSYDKLHTIKEDVYAFGNQSSISKLKHIPPREIKAKDFLRSKANLISSLSPFRKVVWEKNRYKDFVFDDWIFWIDASIENFTFKSSNRINYIYREHFDQSTKKIDKFLETSLVLSYKKNRIDFRLKNEIGIRDNKNYLIIEPSKVNHSYFMLIGELLNRMACLKNSNILLFRNKRITKYYNYYENIFSKINYNVIELDSSFYPKNKNLIKEILKKTNLPQIDKVFFLNDSLNNVKRNYHLGNLNYDIFILNNNLMEFKSLLTKRTIFTFYTQKIKNRFVLNNTDLVTNLPIYFYFEFQKINKGFRNALKLYSKKKFNLKLYLAKLKELLFI
jgi:hypothetical protein